MAQGTICNALDIYRDMLLMRRFEERAGQLYSLGEIGGFCHLYIGQEAVAAGIKYGIQQGDKMITAYRDHALILACGTDPKAVMAELTGRATGCSKGKGGSMHIFDLERNFYGGHGIVGAQVSLGTGLAFAIKYSEQAQISIVLMGDGASNQGQVYESFNMAKLWNLPVLYIIENNGYGMGTSVARASATVELAQRGASFGLPGVAVNGMDFFAVQEAVAQARARIIAGEGPQILEMKTYRYRGHSMSDPAKYRSKDEVEAEKGRDPLISLKKHILDSKIAEESFFKEVEREIKEIMVEVLAFAQNSPLPAEDELWKDVYSVAGVGS